MSSEFSKIDRFSASSSSGFVVTVEGHGGTVTYSDDLGSVNLDSSWMVGGVGIWLMSPDLDELRERDPKRAKVVLKNVESALDFLGLNTYFEP